MGFDFAKRLDACRANDLYRQRLRVETKQIPHVSINGKQLLAFCSNDYLGLAAHPDIEAAFKAGVDQWGVGGGASHLVSGHLGPHHQLEDALARFTGRPKALLFGSGYTANLAVLTVLGGMATSILQDRLNHASLLDGGILAGTRMIRYRHNDPESLARHLEKAGDSPLVVTDGVFSMDGDLADLPALVPLARSYHGCLVVDDAHGFGFLGDRGTGTLGHFGLGANDVPVVIGTLGKAFGTSGAFVAGSHDLIDVLVQFAHSYVYTTSQPPAVACATLKALELVETEGWRRDHLAHLVRDFRREALGMGLDLMDSFTPIQPIMVGENDKAVAASAFLEDRGLMVRAIRPPTVPKGSARLRLTFSAAHTTGNLDQLLSALKEARKKGVL